MINEKYMSEVNKLVDIANKKGSINEEDVYLRLLKYEATASESKEVIEYLESKGIKINYSTGEVSLTFAAAPIIVIFPPRHAPRDRHHHRGWA